MIRFLSIMCLSVPLGTLHAQPLTEPTNSYAETAKRLETLITEQLADKGIPAISIALVEDQKIVWAKGFGFVDPARKVPATAETVYRVGSVSKLFTDLAVMQLVEIGTLDLDAPVTKYLPSFQPKNQFNKAITLRQLMAHRSGLIREPPVGSYFHDDNPTLKAMVDSINGIPLVYEPEKRIKYSNAAIAAVGYTLEVHQKTPFLKYVRDAVLSPLGMKRSDFQPRPDLVKDLAQAVMWTYHGREFPAPTFELGMAPAGCMYSTVNDLARFVSVMFAEGKTANGRILKPETLREMMKPQFAKEGEKTGFGIGFALNELEGKLRVGHGGAIYGFATELAFLPGEKLGVIVVGSKDVANPVVTRIADDALTCMLAVKQKKKLPDPTPTRRLTKDELAKIIGHYESGEKSMELVESNGRLWVFPGRGGFRTELRIAGKQLMSDDLVGFGLKIEQDGNKLRIGKDEYVKVAESQPKPAPAHFAGLIGEYGWDHNVLYIFEKAGKLHALIEWFFLYPLEQEKEDVYRFPDFGLYHGEKLIFQRDKSGKATSVEAASVRFARRKLDGEDGATFRIKPLKSVEELRKAALIATPPQEKGEFRASQLVELSKIDPTIRFDLRYASDNNFLGTPLYPKTAKAMMQKPAAEAVGRVHKSLEKQGYGLWIFDAYRPWYVSHMFWNATPNEMRHFVADPSQGSRHNRGCAVDLTLYDRKTGKPIEMVSGFDEFSDRAYPDYIGGTGLQRYHRDLLRREMAREGFTVYEAEWWHFDFPDWKKYPIENRRFE